MSSWYTQTAFQDDIVVSTRIRLARNLADIPFSSRMTAEDLTKLNNKVKEAVENSDKPCAKGLKFIYMKDIPANERYAMVERHIISREFALNHENRAIILSEDESISIMIGEEDHIRIQILLVGFQVEKAYDIAELVDNMLCESLNIAFDKSIGFLTECPTNLGTGLRTSVMLHLPLIEASGEMSALFNSVSKIGFTVRGMYGEGSSSSASLYQISNQITLGISEKNAIDNLKVITNQLLKKEHEHRANINRLKAEDISMRSLGILENARMLDSSELMNRLSDVKLGLSIGVIRDKNINPIKLLIEGQPYMLMRRFGQMSPEERDIYRASLVRSQLGKGD